jgi:hypothetical protein
VSQETFISYRGFRWFWLTVIALVTCTVIYLVDQPLGGRNGGTVVGYTYGTIAALAIVWLMWYGVRKRSYASTIGTVQGWLAAHVWIGIGLLLLVPLHAGFSFGLNVHTLAYALMVVTILSGIWGIANYATLSARIESHRGGKKDRAVLEQVAVLDDDIEGVLKQKSDAFLKLANRIDFAFKPGLKTLLCRTTVPSVDKRVASELMLAVPETEKEDALKLIGLIDQKSDLLKGLVEEVRIKALLRVWLFVHVPASVGLCGALTIHILSVFFFW